MHFGYAAKKDLKTINRLSQIMPNIGGPRENKRKLYSAVAHSVLLYAAPVWADELTASKSKLHSAQKLVGTRVISGYRTVSLVAVLILAGILLIETQAGILKKVYEKKKELLNLGAIDMTEIQRYQKLLTEDAINKWKGRLNRTPFLGRESGWPSSHSCLVGLTGLT